MHIHSMSYVDFRLSDLGLGMGVKGILETLGKSLP